MAKQRASWRPWSDHPIIASVTAIATVAGIIFTIITSVNTNSISNLEIVGRVIENGNQNPISQAKVYLYFEEKIITIYTDTEGVYRYSFSVNDRESIFGKILIQKNGFHNYEKSIYVNKDNSIIDDIRMDIDNKTSNFSSSLNDEIDRNLLELNSSSICMNYDENYYIPVYNSEFDMSLFENKVLTDEDFIHDDRVCWSRMINVDIRGLNDNITLKIAPYLVLEVINNTQRNTYGLDNLLYIERFDSTAAMIQRSSSEKFFAYIGEDTDKIIAAPTVDKIFLGRSHQIDESSNNKLDPFVFDNEFEFFILEGNDTGEFSLFVEALYNRDIRFKVGIMYSYKGDNTVVWIPEEFYIQGTTTRTKVWQGKPLVFKGEADGDIPGKAAYYTKFLDLSRNISNEYPSFPLNK